MHEAFTAAGSSHRGPVFVDVPMDEFFNQGSGVVPVVGPSRGADPDPDAIAAVARLLAAAARPVLILGTDVWADGAEHAALDLVENAGLPAITNGMGRGVIPGGHPLLVTKARGQALNGADLVVVVGTPLDFRLGYGVFGGKDELPRPARVVHLADSAGQVAQHAELAGSAYGDLTAVLDRRPRRPRQGRRHSAASPTGPPGWTTSRPACAPPPSATASCSAPRPTRSTRPASTASWCRGWPTTPWSSATAATSSASRASTSSRSVPAAGSTRARTAASAPGSARRSPPGSRGRRRRSCCCSATGRPASR